MADITEAEQWDTGVYQLETTDPVQGGADGVDNLPHKALANRTLWLKAQVALKALVGGSAAQLFKAKAGEASDDVVNKGQLDTKIDLATANSYDLGVGQTWVDETANRAENTVYTNTTGRPIVVSITADYNYTARVALKVDGVVISQGSDKNDTAYSRASATALVPNGSTYEGTSFINVTAWLELK